MLSYVFMKLSVCSMKDVDAIANISKSHTVHVERGVI